MVKTFGFSSKLEAFAFLILAIIFIPFTTYIRLRTLSNPLIFDPHGRQMQTALTTYYMAKDQASFFDYRSPYDGELWQLMAEFPLYQYLSSRLMKFFDLSIEIASRLIALLFFAGCLILFSLIVFELTKKKGLTLWTALIFWIIPFNVLFSRGGLIDFPALFFTLLSIWSFIKVFKNNNKYWWYIILSLLAGSVGSVVKIFVWYIWEAIALIFLILRFRSYPKTKTIPALCVLAMEGIISVSWLLWVHYIGTSFSLQSNVHHWLLGPLSFRLDMNLWRNIFHTIRISILNDWLVLPFMIGLIVQKNNRIWINIAIMAILISLLVNFRPFSAQHDHYFIINICFFVFITATGIEWIFEKSRKVVLICLLIIVPLLVYRTTKLKYLYGNMFADQSKDFLYARELKQVTEEDEIIFISQEIVGGGLQIPLYSERYIKFIKKENLRDEILKLQPALFIFDSDLIGFSSLSHYETIWIIDASTEVPFYRVKNSKRFLFDPSNHIGVSKKLLFNLQLYSSNAPRRVNVCEKNFVVLKLDALNKNIFKIQSIGRDKTFYLPKLNYLYLPNTDKYGCEFLISEAP